MNKFDSFLQGAQTIVLIAFIVLLMAQVKELKNIKKKGKIFADQIECIIKALHKKKDEKTF